MNLNNLTIKSQEAVQRAQQIAMERQHQPIELGHLMKGILETDEQVTPFVFKKLGVNVNVIRQTVDSIVQSYPKVSGGEQYLSRTTAEALQKANTALKEFGDEYVALEHLLLGILRTRDQVAQLLKDSGFLKKG
jgi:ATP-dependent Clp protease ATP-binding subunit ClpB